MTDSATPGVAEASEPAMQASHCIILYEEVTLNHSICREWAGKYYPGTGLYDENELNDSIPLRKYSSAGFLVDIKTICQ